MVMSRRVTVPPSFLLPTLYTTTVAVHEENRDERIQLAFQPTQDRSRQTSAAPVADCGHRAVHPPAALREPCPSTALPDMPISAHARESAANASTRRSTVLISGPTSPQGPGARERPQWTASRVGCPHGLGCADETPGAQSVAMTCCGDIVTHATVRCLLTRQALRLFYYTTRRFYA